MNTLRIIDIARLAGVSAGTVDRVIHRRGRVADEKREKIEQIMKDVHYEPNMVARFLAHHKKYAVAVLAPTFQQGDYWQLVCKGIDSAAEDLKNFNVLVKFFHFNQYDRESFIEATNQLKVQHFDGVIVATLFGELVVELSNYLKINEIPFIYIDSAIPHQNDLAYFGGDSYQDGLIAAKLLLKEIGLQADLFFAHIRFKHSEISMQMKTREQGVLDGLAQQNFCGNITHLEINTDNYADNIEKLNVILNKNEDLIGGIVLNSRIYELIKVLNNFEVAQRSRFVLLGHEAIEENIVALKNGKIVYLLSQRPELQGYDALKAMGNYILFNQTPAKENFMPIDILIRENVGYYV
ncbi:MAG: LacI family DNA-binding transcriptional regulator [Prevotellaceae bacterium]|jgi:LacI family transcriptional regulator|nr:LacI family DNA-binding transcriptional regulator [Prevotellaceae bacterium]